MEIHSESKSDSVATKWKPSGHWLHLASQNGEKIQWYQLLLPHVELRLFQNMLCFHGFLIRTVCIFRNYVAHWLPVSAVLWLSARINHYWPSLTQGLNQIVSKMSTSNRNHYNIKRKGYAVLIYHSQRLLNCSHRLQGIHYSAHILVSWKLPLKVSKPKINVASQHQWANQ